MTIVAGYTGMPQGHRECAMIESSRFPTWIGGMTLFTSGWELTGRMVWIGCGSISALMTVKTIHREFRESAIGMAFLAIE